MSKEQRITGNITPPNKDLETLKNHFPQCFDKSGNLDFEKLKKQLSKNEINFSKESYGMDWLGKSYARLLATDETTTLLKEDETFNQKAANKNSENLLIKGDNLEVLKHLSNAYYEKIKMIYIDPPYNTGSDGFVYQDDRKFTADELQELAGISEERAKRILDFTQSNSNSHSAWLTFIYPRLYIAKQLLKEDGVIFISIDDNEVAQLRLLMDEVFGEENFVAEFVWSGKSGSEDDSHIRNNKEYILSYAKNINGFDVGLDIKTEAKFIYYDDNKKDNYKRQLLRKWGDNSRREDRPNLYYPIKSETNKDFYPTLPDGEDGCWRWSKETMQTAVEQGKVEFATNGKYEAYEKIYKSDESKKTKKFKSLLLELGSSSVGTKELKKMFENKKIFSNPKPTILLKQALRIANSNNDLILDFFAGSGTTGDAVMQLNAADGGNRKFILVQLSEKIDQKNNKTAYDFVKDELGVEEPTIFEITKERLIRASKKINAEIDEKNENLKTEIKALKQEIQTEETKQEIKKLNKEITQNSKLKTQNSFKVFETMPIWEDYNFEADELEAEQMQLFDESKLTEEDIKALLVTWKTYDGVSLSEPLQDIDLTDYTANYSNGKLYLMDKGFKTKNLKTLLEKIDSDKDFNPTTIIAFGYHFESKNLREISENIKSYTNKKSIDIDFITRY